MENYREERVRIPKPFGSPSPRMRLLLWGLMVPVAFYLFVWVRILYGWASYIIGSRFFPEIR